MMRMGEEKQQYEPMSLFSDIPLAKAYPNRALSKEEMYLTVAIRYQVQEMLKMGADYRQPLEFVINPNDIAKEKGLKKMDSFRLNFSKSVQTFRTHIPAETLHYTDKNGNPRTYLLPLVMGIDIGDTTNEIAVKVNPDYQKYVVEKVFGNPELRIEKRFYLSSKCKYSYPLSNWLIAMIAEQRNLGIYSKKYDIIASLDEVRNKVPSASPKMITSNYLIKVIRKAVNDINENPDSSIRILNDNFVYSKNGKNIYELIFQVEVSLSDASPLFFSKPDMDLIDEDDVPSWEYIEQHLKKLHINSSYIPKVKNHGRKYAWKILLYTLVRGGDARYFNKVFENYRGNDTIYGLATTLKVAHPELCDNVVDTIIMSHDSMVAVQKDELPQFIETEEESGTIKERLEKLRQNLRA